MNMDAVNAKDCALVLVDYQARLMPAIHDAAAVVANGVLLAQAAQALDIPVVGMALQTHKPRRGVRATGRTDLSLVVVHRFPAAGSRRSGAPW